MFEPKWPGVCAFIVGGFFVGAVLHGDVLGILVCATCVIIDCFRYVKR